MAPKPTQKATKTSVSRRPSHPDHFPEPEQPPVPIAQPTLKGLPKDGSDALLFKTAPAVTESIKHEDEIKDAKKIKN